MDARIDPAAAPGISLGDAHVIRNAGGNAQDGLWSILISQLLLGTREIVLIKHTGCGMLTFSNEDARDAVQGNRGKLQAGFDFQPFADLEAAVRGDARFLREHEALPQGVAVSGWVYDVTTWRVRQII